MADDEGSLRFELKNSKPIDLLDLTAALTAFGEAYQDYAVESGHDIEPGNIRLFIREIRSGSVIADLISLADQGSLVLKHIDVVGGFMTHFNEILRIFLKGTAPDKLSPTRREATQAIAIMEPIAKDGGAQLFMNVNGDIHHHIHHHYDSQQANAIQNNARRFLGRQIPVSKVHTDQLLTLYQVRDDPKSAVGDRGIIEEISPTPAKLQFVSEQVKRQVIDQPSNPFQKVFLVDVEAKASDGKVRLYRILAVKDVIDRD